MDKHVKSFISELFQFNMQSKYLFQEVCGFTFVFREDITTINDDVSSAEILPVGIIYEENDEYYYAPLYGNDEIDEIIKEYVESI